VHVGFFDAKEVSHILDVPENVAVVEMTPLGYPDGTVKPPARKPVQDFVSYEKFGSR
jgi:nitroreductase